MAYEYKQLLSQIFSDSHISEEQINEVINLVLENNCLSTEENLEEMINLLVESGDSTLASSEEGATGVTLSKSDSNFNKYRNQLMTLFPDICPSYLKHFCENCNPFDFDEVVENLAQTDYVKLDKDPLDVWEHLKQMLPNADPTYLKNQARVLVERPVTDLEEFIEKAIQDNNYPTMQEYLKNQEVAAGMAFYLKNFSAEAFLNQIPNPAEFFTGPNRSTQIEGESDLEFSLTCLYNIFPYLRKTEIAKIFDYFEKNLVKTYNKLKTVPKAFRTPRPPIELHECKNIELLKEVAYITHEKKIRQFLKQKDEKYRIALEEARREGLLQTCGCCFDDNLIPEECYFCNKGCIFCKDCVKAGAETVIGKEETKFPCLADCDSEFDYSVLQMVLEPKVFQGVFHRKQIEEIRNANIDGLETCLFCDYCMIPDEGDKIFKCANSECMAEICRLCRHRSHVPKRCDEIEYDEDVQKRTFIENKMTEALLRKCWKCSKQFYKESGCNKMTCYCGAKMCYVCGAAVTDYTHFGPGRCPLYTDNLQQFHLNRVLQGAQQAKNELGINETSNRLKFDPTVGVENQVA